MHYFIGIDGGGTKTEGILINQDGETVSTFIDGPSNPHSTTQDHAFANLANVINHLLKDCVNRGGSCSAICLGIAGVDKDSERNALLEFVDSYKHQLGTLFKTYIKNDAEITILAAFDESSGISAISGTGSIIYGVTPDGTKYRVGGWGHILGDQGSGYHIAQQALQAAMQSFDGSGPHTMLEELIVKAYRFSSLMDLRTYIYQPTIKKQDIADFSKLCIEASEKGDEQAKRIIVDAAEQLAHQTKILIRKHSWFINCGIAASGSIMKHSGLFLNTFKSEVKNTFPYVNIRLTVYSPAYGAAKYALRTYNDL